MKRLLLITFSFLLIAAPVYAQTATPVPIMVDPGSGLTVSLPEGSPWWAAIALAVVSGGIYLIRGYSGRLDKKSQAALEGVKSEFEYKLKQLDLQQTEKSTSAVQVDALANSIQNMADAVTRAYTVLAQERSLAAEERKNMQQTLNDQQKGITERNEATRAIGERVGELTDKVAPIDGRLKTVVETLEEVKRTMVTLDVLKDALHPLEQRIDDALKVAHDLQKPLNEANGTSGAAEA